MKRTAVLLLLLGGCAAEQANYPSLAPRPGERQGFEEPMVAAPAPVAADPALDARLAAAQRTLRTIRTGFDAEAARVRTASAAAGVRTVGSEAWLSAQAALAGLDDWRAQATALASDLATAAGERLGSVGTPYPALDALQAAATAEAEREGTVAAQLSAALPTP